MQSVEKTQAEMSLTSLQEILVNLSNSSDQRTSVVSAIRDDINTGVDLMTHLHDSAEREKRALFKTMVENVSTLTDLSLEYFASVQDFMNKSYKKVGNVFYPKWMLEGKINTSETLLVTVTEIKDIMYEVIDMMGIDQKLASENVTRMDGILEAIKGTKPGDKKQESSNGGFSLSSLKDIKLPNPADLLKIVGGLGALAKVIKPAFNKVINSLNDNLGNLLDKIDEKRVESFSVGITKMTDVMEKMKDVTKPLAIGLGLVSASMLVMSLIPLSPSFIMTLGLFVGMVAILNKVVDGKKLPDMQRFGIGIAAMTTGLVLLNFVEWESVFKMVGFVYLLGFALRSYGQKRVFPDMILFSTSITIMTVALIGMNLVSWQSVFMLPAFTFMLGLTLSKFTKARANNLLNLSYGVGILTLSLVAMQAVDWTAPVLLLGFVSSLLLVVWAFNKNNKGGGKMGMSPITSFAFGIGILTLSLFALQEVEWDTVWKAVVFVGLMSVITRVGAGSRTKGMIGFATGIGILTLTMFAMREIDYTTVFKTVVFIGGLGLALRLFPKTGIPMMWSIAGGIGIMTLSLLVFKKSGFTWEDGLTLVGTIGALAAVVALVGLAAPVTGVGSAIMIVMGAAALIFAGSLWLINKMDIDKEQIDNFGSMLVNLSIAYAKATPYAVLGIVSSALFIPIGVASIITAGAFMAISSLTITPENIDSFAYSIKAISLSYAKALPSVILGVVSSVLFLPIAAVSLATAGVLHLIGKADINQSKLDAFNTGMKSIVESVNQFGIVQLGKVMIKSKELLPLMELSLKMSETMKNIGDSKVTPADMDSFADTIVTYVDRMSKVINDSVSKVKGAKEGIEAIASLTGVAYTLADTINKMSNMEIVTHKMKDGQLVVKDVKKFDWESDMKKIAPNIGRMISALAEPLILLAAAKDEIVIGGVKIKNPFSKKNKKGIEFIKSIGDAYQPIVDSVSAVANLEISRDPKLLEQFKVTMLETTATLASVYNDLMKLQPNANAQNVIENITSLVKSFSGSNAIKEFNIDIKETVKLLTDASTWNRVMSNMDKVAVKVERVGKAINGINVEKISAFERNLRLLLEKNNSDKLVELLEKLLKLIGMTRDENNGNVTTVSTPPRSVSTVIQPPASPVQTSNERLDRLIDLVSAGMQGIVEGLEGTNNRLAGTLRVKNVDGSPANNL